MSTPVIHLPGMGPALGPVTDHELGVDPDELGACYCDHLITVHTGPGDECENCDCRGYAERDEVTQTLDVLDYDDWENDRTRGNTQTAVELTRRARLRAVTGGGGAA